MDITDRYGRVTDAERYRPLHEAARSIVTELGAKYRVSVTEGGANRVRVADPDAVQRLSLRPADDQAAPIDLVLTTFPGVRARLGRWCDEAWPSCGCDACDEDPDVLAAELAEAIEDVVAGRFEETWTFNGAGYSRWSEGHTQSRGGWRRGRPVPLRKLLVTPLRIRWQPWPSSGGAG